MLHRLLIALVACAVLAPSEATATTYSGQRPADARTEKLVGIALEFWADRGITGCPNGIRSWTAADLMDVDITSEFMVPFGRGRACEVWFLREQLHTYRYDSYPARDGAGDECADVFHEVRHALPGGTEGGIDGHGHTADGIMAAQPEVVPWACRKWARRTVRRRRG